MIDQATREKYTPTIGIECHVQFNTVTKLFAAVSNDARSAEPNSLVSHICLGMPGALPVLNKKAIELCIRAALAFRTTPNKLSIFDRKHYFYPDLPKGYQITQLHYPIIESGEVVIDVDGQQKSIRLTRAHLEEDAGKSTHPAGKDYSLVDLNRAGTPLLEVVSEPIMHSAAEAKAYAKELYLLMRYADVSDADLYHGNMRFDVNVSVSKDPLKMGTRTETKNLNSFRSIEKAVEFEINRQITLLEKGATIIQETRGWDDGKQKTISQRSKEDSHEYRYFPDPDLPPVVITEEMIEDAKKAMPIMPHQWRERLRRLGLDSHSVETLLDAEVQDKQIIYLPLIESYLEQADKAKFIANMFVNIEIPFYATNQGAEHKLNNEQRRQLMDEVYELTKAGKLSSTAAKALVNYVLNNGIVYRDLEKYAGEQGFIQISDEAEIAAIVKKVLAENPQAAEDVRNGEMKAIGFLVGQVMKQSLGKANPQLSQKLIKEQLNL